MSPAWSLAAAFTGYFLGSLPFGYVVARAHGVDIFKEGSGNPGATNVKRVLGEKFGAKGKRAGNLVFALDAVKGALAAGSTPFTPAVSIVAALDVSLGLLLEEGLDAAFARHAALGRACREGAKAMGLELFSPDEERSAVVTAILTPEGVDAKSLVLELRDRFGITIAGAHGELGSRMFRIGHIGYFDVLDITTALTATETLLLERGAAIEPGVAVARALEAYNVAARV